MILEIIKKKLTSLLSWYKGAMYRSPDLSQITKFRGKFTTKLDFQLRLSFVKDLWFHDGNGMQN